MPNKPFSFEEGRLLKAALHPDRGLSDEKQQEAYVIFMREADKLIEDKPRPAARPTHLAAMTGAEREEYAAVLASIEPAGFRRLFAASAYEAGWGLEELRKRVKQHQRSQAASAKAKAAYAKRKAAKAAANA
jgi:hypothetical protein